MAHEMTSGHEHDMAYHPGLRPRLPIRRFDVFAEYNRLRGLTRGLDEPRAKGYGLWVAKVVASGGGRRGGAKVEPGEAGELAGQAQRETPALGWHFLGDEPQTDALFDREIVQRMGPEFYRIVFAPAIDQAYEQGKSYEGIRDTIRKDWKPARSP
jgi:hypothetical protein